MDWIAETSEDLKLDITTVHVAALYLDRVLLKAHDASSGRCLIPRHLWQLVAMVCLRVAGKFEEREEDVTGDANGMLCVAGEQRVNAVEAFTRHLGDAAQSVTPAQIREWEIFVLEQGVVEVFKRCGDAEFRFIEISGLYFGFLLGIVQVRRDD